MNNWISIELSKTEMGKSKRKTRTTSGRPKKIPRFRVNAGRKPVPISQASATIIRERAVELSNNERYNSVKVLELTIKILNKRLDEGNNDVEANESINDECNNE